MATAYTESATATLVTMVTTVAKATPSLCSHVTTSNAKMVPNATALLTTVDFSANALKALLVLFVRERFLLIHALVRLVVAMVSVPPQKVGKLQSVTATEVGGESPAIKRSIFAKK